MKTVYEKVEVETVQEVYMDENCKGTLWHNPKYPIVDVCLAEDQENPLKIVLSDKNIYFPTMKNTKIWVKYIRDVMVDRIALDRDKYIFDKISITPENVRELEEVTDIGELQKIIMSLINTLYNSKHAPSKQILDNMDAILSEYCYLLSGNPDKNMKLLRRKTQ